MGGTQQKCAMEKLVLDDNLQLQHTQKQLWCTVLGHQWMCCSIYHNGSMGPPAVGVAQGACVSLTLPTALHCPALCCTALHCTAVVLHRSPKKLHTATCLDVRCQLGTAPHYTVLYCTVLCCTVLYCTALYCHHPLNHTATYLDVWCQLAHRFDAIGIAQVVIATQDDTTACF